MKPDQLSQNGARASRQQLKGFFLSASITTDKVHFLYCLNSHATLVLISIAFSHPFCWGHNATFGIGSKGDFTSPWPWAPWLVANTTTAENKSDKHVVILLRCTHCSSSKTRVNVLVLLNGVPFFTTEIFNFLLLPHYLLYVCVYE